MKVALMGGTSASYAALDALIRNDVELTGVLGLDESLADRESDYCSLRDLAAKASLPFLPFTSIRDRQVELFIRTHRPDLLWVVGFTQNVPDSLIRLARDGCVGYHPTMLPRGRGRSPITWTMLQGEPAGATLYFLAGEPETGDIIMQRQVPVHSDDYAGDLVERTNQMLALLVKELSPLIRLGSLPRIPQEHRKATQYSRRTREDDLIDWNHTTDRILRLIRATSRPFTGATTTLGSTTMNIWRARPASPLETDPVVGLKECGSILKLNDEGHAMVRTGDGGLWMTDFTSNGHTRPIELAVGKVLGSPAAPKPGKEPNNHNVGQQRLR